MTKPELHALADKIHATTYPIPTTQFIKHVAAYAIYLSPIRPSNYDALFNEYLTHLADWTPNENHPRRG